MLDCQTTLALVSSVAAKSGASKVSVYRRWPSKGALAFDVLLEYQDFGPVPDTGRTRDDLVAIVRVSTPVSPTPRPPPSSPGWRPTSLALRRWQKAFRERFVLPRRRSVAEAIERAMQRGDLPTESDEDLLIDLLSSPFFYRIFITGHRVETDLAVKLVDFVLLRQIPKKAASAP
jgi:AcrR family transcriptional regulator